MPRILIAEDEDRIASFLQRGLTSNGFSTVVLSNGADVLALVNDDDYDLLLLDLGLPGVDGMQVLSALRQRQLTIPVIILTARDEINDRVDGLNAGADDYLTKPFAFEELLARVRVQLRDTGHRETTVITHGPVELDLRTRRAIVAGRTVDLTAREFALAETFLRHPGQVLSQEQLLSHVWGYDFDPGSNVVQVYVRYLRQKLGEDFIKTVRGAGYRFEPAAS
ncbi:response regulator transcription factor [Euzebya tangerina]|uniref:response regulator transcription factor n=1 Tax=Euzebya tangerina TaxID=591198 RepID=UPI000E31439C|nr:response regulator transcription factor [Euzebya tangerina]